MLANNIEHDPRSVLASAEMSTKWGQGTFYNELCPADSRGPDGHVKVGCNAVAVGQIMKFYNHPSVGYSSHTFFHGEYGYHFADFGSTAYSFFSMPNELSNYNTPVARLLYHIGIAMEINWGWDSTSGDNGNAAHALSEFFGYSTERRGRYRKNFEYVDWFEMLKHEIEAGRPVLYRGEDEDGGSAHAFVLDGVTYNSWTHIYHWHINWGWYGSKNEWYMLDFLTPGDNGPYNHKQTGLFFLFPCDRNNSRIANNLELNDIVVGTTVYGEWFIPRPKEKYAVARDTIQVANTGYYRVEKGAISEMIANKIIINKGFTAESGSFFKATRGETCTY